MANTKTICHKCKGEVDVSEVQYIPKGNDEMMIICSNCSGKKPNTQVIKKEKPIKKIFTTQTKKRTLNKTSQTSKKINYFCTRCQYKFRYNTESYSKLKCPYCGKDDRIIKDKTDANTLLREVSADDFDEKFLY